MDSHAEQPFAVPTRRRTAPIRVAVAGITLTLGALVAVGLLTDDSSEAVPTCTKTWVGAAGASANTGSNWSPSGVPVPCAST